MLINFENMQEYTIPNLNGGAGEVSAKMFVDPAGKVMLSRIPAGASIGMHSHATSFEVNYVLSGCGEAVCSGKTEPLRPGTVHYCPRGDAHSIINTGKEELVLFTVVPEK